KLILPEDLGMRALTTIHCASHMGIKRIQDLVRHTKIKIRDPKIEQIVANCKACQLTNAMKNPNNPGTRLRGRRPGAYWETDFTKVKSRLYGYKSLLVFIDTFSGWTEAFPTKHETAQIVAKKRLEDIFPRYGFPQMIGSDNGPAFVSKVSQSLAKVLGTDWKLHCAYRPQSSG
ncbi:TF28 protein, partial [Crocuta crocuta]